MNDAFRGVKMKKSKWLLFVMIMLLLTACGQNDAAEEQTSDENQFEMVGRWEMVGEMDGISYVFEFHADNSGVSFASPHSFRDLTYDLKPNEIQLDYYQGGQISSSETMGIAFDGDDQITLTAGDGTSMTLKRFPLPDTPAFVRARVALMVSNAEHTILEAEQEDERTWYATVQVAGEENSRRFKIYLDDSGEWMPSEVQP
jgi:uncharacterized protein (TIGR03066 family)